MTIKYDKCAIKISFNAGMNTSSIINANNYTITGVKLLRLLYASSQNSNTIRVFFSADIGTSALDRTNYVFTYPTGLPLTPISVTQVDAMTVDITTSGSMRTGTDNYTITASNIYDIHGNELDPSYVSHTFNGFGVDPQVSSATYINSTTLDVLFDQNVESTSAETTDNYEITDQSEPLITAAVLQGDNKTVRLTISPTFTSGDYTVTVTGVTNTIGCSIDLNHNSDNFTVVGLADLPFENHETLTNGLVAYYPMNTTADDIYVNAINGTYPDTTPWVDTGIIGESLYLCPQWWLPGTRSVMLPDSAILNTLDFCSLSAWIKIPDLSAATWHAIGGRYGQFAVSVVNDGRLYIQVYTVDGKADTASTVTVTAGSWHHIACTFDGSRIRGYIDSVRVISTSLAEYHTLINTSALRRWRFGCAQNIPSDNDDIHSALTGYLDEVGIWDRALTKQEVADLYNSGAAVRFNSVAPQVSAASATSSTNVRVTFDKDMCDGYDTTELTKHDNYAFTCPPGYTITVVDVTKVDSTHVDITVDENMETGTNNYTVEVSNVEDLTANTIDPAHNSALFNGIHAPRMVSATAFAAPTNKVTVTFDEEMDEASVETLGNWSFPTQPGSAPITKASATKTAATTVDIVVTGEMLNGTNNYSVQADDVKNSAGITINSSYKLVTFNGVGVSPSVSSAAYVDSTHCTVTFSENMDTTTAQTTGNYVLSGPSSPSVSTAVLAGNVVTLTLGTAMVNGLYTVTVSNITDIAGNTINPNPGTPTFTAVVIVPENIVLCSGLINAGGTSDKTWLWDGGAQTWTEKATGAVTKPGSISNHASAYDSFNGKSIIYGGLGGDQTKTWSWDGTTEAWTQLIPAHVPSAVECQAGATAYDTVRKRIVHFGGYKGAADQATYEWDGSDWTLINPATKPAARWFHSMAFDENRNVVVLFGGMDAVSRKQDTWEYNGTDWTEKASGAVTKPSTRSQTAMAYCPVLKKILLFGGTNDDPGVSRNCETWSWDGSDWVQLVVGGVEGTDKPSKRFGHAMACDHYNSQIVLFSGQDGTNNTETWIWNGSTWTKLVIVGSVPASLRNHSMCGSKKP